MRVHIDFETRSACDLRKCGADIYAKHPTTDVVCMGWAIDGDTVEIWKPGDEFPFDLRCAIEDGASFAAHNAGFELLIWEHVCVKKYNWPRLPVEKTFCTMAMCYAMALPGSLEKAAPAAGIAERKDLAGGRVMLQISQPRSIKENGEIVWWTDEEKYQKVYDYCKQDVEVEREIDKRVVPLSDYEREVWLLDYEINRRGIGIDVAAAKIALRLVETEKARLDLRIREVTNNAVATCSAATQLKDWIKLKGIDVEGVAKSDVIELLATPDLPLDVKQALLLRQEAAKTSTAKLESMINRAGVDHRIRGTIQYHGANTGRFAGRGLQVHNFPRPKISQTEIEAVFDLLSQSDAGEMIEMLHGSVLSVISDCLRGFIRAKDGHELVGADFSAIEARVLAWLAGQESVLNVFRGDGKIYEHQASDIFHVKLKDVTDAQRQIGKVAILALGYQGGTRAFQSMAKNYNVIVSDLDAKNIMLSWRSANPKIVKYWYDLNEAAKTAVLNPGQEFKAGAKPVTFKKSGSFLWCKLPSGRVLCYPYPEIQPLETPWGGAKDGLTYMSEDGFSRKWDRVKTYGGSLAENITQAVSRDILVEGLFRAKKKGYPIVMHVHDELVVETPIDSLSVTDFENLLSENPIWAQGLPLKSKGFKRKRYGK